MSCLRTTLLTVVGFLVLLSLVPCHGHGKHEVKGKNQADEPQTNVHTKGHDSHSDKKSDHEKKRQKSVKSNKKTVDDDFHLDEVVFHDNQTGNSTKCDKALDLVIALDSSESMREANWTKLIRFTKDMVKTLDLNLTRIAVIRYNGVPEIPVPLGYFQSQAAFSATLDGVFYEPGGTRTDNALSKALLVFYSGGHRRASKVLVVVTDNPTNDIRLTKETLISGKELVERASKGLKAFEVSVFGVGIQYGLTGTEIEDLNEELKMITQDEDGEKRIVEVVNFEELLSSANKVAGKICLVNGGWSSWSPWSKCTVSCGAGTKVRQRSCDNPKPANNGTECADFGGSSVETATCNVFSCTGVELTAMTQQALQVSSHPNTLRIHHSNDCPNGFHYVYVEDNQMSASSVYTDNTGSKEIAARHAAPNGKLYNIFNAGAWCAERSEAMANSKEQYIQLDLKVPTKIAKLATQGQASMLAFNWVTFYRFNYSVDGKTWKQYGKLLPGNQDRQTVNENLISPAVMARYVRFIAIHWNFQKGGGNDICMRVGVFTCKAAKKARQVYKEKRNVGDKPKIPLNIRTKTYQHRS